MLYDKDIREPLFDFLEETYGKVRIIEEKNIGMSRADVIMVRDGEVCGVEIKSDADSYVRLSRQVPDYDKYFDRNYVAVGSSHAQGVAEHVPDHWGIITIDQTEGGADFYVLREAASNSNVDMVKKLSLLWRPELAHIQEVNSMHKYAYLSKLNVIGKIIDYVEPDILNRQITDELFERDYDAIADTINAYRAANGLHKRRRRRKKKKRGNASI